MFKGYLTILILAWLGLVLSCFELLYPSSESKIAYQRLMNDRDQVKKEYSEEKSRSIQQARDHVSKQILYQRGADRMQCRLVSDSSELVYSKREKELVERFQNLTCIMQEKFIHAANQDESNRQAPSAVNTQTIRQFKAREALYFYKNGQLEAEEVEVIHYLLPDTLWPTSLDHLSPLFQGKAHTMHLSLFKEPTLKAQGFQAVFHHGGDE